MFDLYFFYQFTGRFILFLQYSKSQYSYKQITKFENIIIFFNLKYITDLDALAITNYFYFFRYFFGVLPYFTNYKHEFNLNIHYYSYFLEYRASKKNLYFYLFIFLNDMYYPINEKYIELNKDDDFFEFSIIDMNFFIEKKNTLGFFSLNIPINFKFFFTKKIEIEVLNFFYLFKFTI
jgi:hypothetical protein